MKSTKCPMCKSRNVIKIQDIIERPYRFENGEEIIIYPTKECLNCNAKFDIRKKNA